jgi:hypothetical protein
LIVTTTTSSRAARFPPSKKPAWPMTLPPPWIQTITGSRPVPGVAERGAYTFR